MSKGVLDFLGYEDLEEFKTFTNDVADLFEQRPGYVYRFKNFSWINYVLHSGAPNKNAILHLKNNKDVEVRILIEEIFLIDNSNNEGFYKVVLQPIQGYQPKSFSSDTIQATSPYEPIEFESQPLPESKDFLSAAQESSFTAQEPIYDDSNEKTNLDQEDTDISNSDISFMDSSDFSIDSNETPEFTKPLPVSFDESLDGHLFKEDETDFTKIDFEDDISQEPSSIYEDDIPSEPSSIYEDDIPPEPSIYEAQEPIEPDTQVEKSVDLDEDVYNPAEAMDILGLEPNELKLFLHEYCDHIEMVAIALEDAISEHDTDAKHALLMQLKGTGQHLRTKRINSLLETLTHSDDLESLEALQSYAHKLKTLPIETDAKKGQ
jgi:hypothetical protein